MANILLTGNPRSGKSTLLEKVISELDNKFGFLTREIREGNQRVGFEVVTYNGQTIVLAHKDMKSEHRVSKYGVDVGAFNTFIKPYLNFKKGNILYLDEIGEMQLFAPNFRQLVSRYLNSKNHLVATITQTYSSLYTDMIKNRSDIQLIGITPQNRDEKYHEVKKLLESNLL